MRTKMFFAMLVIFLCGSGKLNAQEAPKVETTVLKVFQILGSSFGILKAQVVIIEPGGFTDAIELEKIKSSENMISNAQIIKKELDKWMEKGFKVEAFSENTYSYFWTETYILTKR